MCLTQQEDDQACRKTLAYCLGGRGWKVRTTGLKELITRRPHGAFRTCRPHSASHAIDKLTEICHSLSLAILKEPAERTCSGRMPSNLHTWSLRLLQPSPTAIAWLTLLDSKLCGWNLNGYENVLVKGKDMVIRQLANQRREWKVMFYSSKLKRQLCIGTAPNKSPPVGATRTPARMV